MTTQQVQQIIDLITNVGGKLSTAAFAIAVRQVLIDGWMSVIVPSIVYTACLFSARLVVVVINSKDYSGKYPDLDENDRSIKTFFLYFLLSIATVLWLLFLTNGISKLLNPQWYAIHYLLSSVR